MKKLIPPNFLTYINLIKVRKKYPNNRIMSGLVNLQAQLGKGCWINRDVYVGEKVIIGDYSYVNKGSIVASGVIGKFCSIGPYCLIGMDEHPMHFISSSPFTYSEKNITTVISKWDHFLSPPIIENDVWIGANVTVLQGVRVGTGAILAAGSVITKDVPPYTIVGGIPASVIKNRFKDETCKMLLESQWWNKTEDDLNKFFQENQNSLQ